MFFYKAYFRFTIYFINYAFVKSIVWQLEAWKRLVVESRNGAFNGRTIGLVRVNGTEYCITIVPMLWPFKKCPTAVQMATVVHTNGPNVVAISSETAANPVHISRRISYVFLL